MAGLMVGGRLNGCEKCDGLRGSGMAVENDEFGRTRVVDLINELHLHAVRDGIGSAEQISTLCIPVEVSKLSDSILKLSRLTISKRVPHVRCI